MKPTFLLCFLTLSLFVNAQWHSLQGPYGGYIKKSENSGISTYVSTVNGLYRSDNEGKNWIRLDAGLPEYHNALGFCVDNNEVFLAYSDYKTKQIAFVYSNDKGNHWMTRTLPSSKWSLDWYVEMVYSGGILMVPGDQQYIESYDKGLSWNSAHLNNSDPYSSIQANHSYIFISEDEHTIYRRAIGDTSWLSLYSSSDYCYLTHVTDSLIIILKDRAPGVRSVDNGVTWQTMSVEGDREIADFGDSIYMPNYYGDIYKSTDKGLNWNLIKSFNNNSFTFFNTRRAGNSLLGEASDLLIRTENEFNTFETSSTGIFSANGSRIIATDSFLFVSTNASVERYDLIHKKWNDKSLLIGEYVQDLFYLHGRLFVLVPNSDSLLVSSDQGLSFSKVWLQIFEIHESQKFKMLEFQDKLIITSIYGSEISNDYGASWEILTSKDSLGNSISTNEIVLYNKQLILAARDIHTQRNLYYTSGDLKNWTLLTLNFPSNSIEYYFQEFYVAENEIFFQLYFNQQCNLFKYDPNTHDLIACKGISNECFNSSSVNQRIIANNNLMLLNTEEAYYKSENGGLDWIRVVDELNNNSSNIFYDLATKDQTIYVASAYFGVLQTTWDDLKLIKTKGFVFYDKDNDDKFTSNDEPLLDAFVKLKRSNQYLPTRDQGNFSFLSNSAIIDTMIPIYHTKHGYFNPKQLPFNVGDTTLQFAYKFPSNIEDATVLMYDFPRARPGFKYFLDILVKNQGSVSCSGDLILNYDAIFNFISSSIPPDNQSNNTLVWKINDLKSLQEQHIIIDLYLPASVALNTLFNHHLNFTNLSINDIDLSDNEVYFKDRVVGSCDPNEMTVDKETFTKQDLNNKQVLTYTIYFQNTGNNEAEFVKLYNDISYFDLNTFHIIASSHPFSYQIDDNGRMEVSYDMIHLPDSLSSESKSHGYFSYSIVPRADRIYNNAISNGATIYFDYNTGISTNNAITLVQDIVDSKNLNEPIENIIVIPNPNSGNFELYGTYLKNNQIDAIRIYNLQGQCVYELNDMIHQGYKLNVQDLNSGLYFLKLGYSDKMVCKVLIQK